MVLCGAFLKISQDPVTGTEQYGKVFYARVADTFREDLLAKGDHFPKRTTSAITKEFRDNISKQAQRFASSWSYIKHAKLTGNPTEEDLIRGATAHYLGKKDWYAAIRGAVNANGSPIVDTVRILPCWRVLRVLDKYSGAAYDMATGTAADDVFILNDEGQPILSKRGVGADFQGPPGGTKARKAAISTSIALVRECAANTKAMQSIGETARLRLQVAYMSDPSIRDTEEGRRFHANLLKQIMLQSDAEAARSGAGPSSAAGAERLSSASTAGRESGDAVSGARAFATPPSPPRSP